MTTLLILCAAADVGHARAIALLLGAEGYDARIVHRLSETREGTDERVCGVVLWSHAAVLAWPVFEAAERLFAERLLVQVSLDGVAAPQSMYTDIGPVDFSAWRANDRGAIAWRTLRERLQRLTETEKTESAHVGGIGALIAASVSIMALSTADRVLEGAPSFDIAPQNSINVAANDGPAIPDVAAGGPVTTDAALEDDTIFFRSLRVPAPVRLSAAPPLPELQSMAAMDAPPIARPSFLRRVLSAAEGLTQIGAPPPQT